MEIKKVKNRSVLFTSAPAATWDLNVHLIRGNKNNYIIDTGLGGLNTAPIREYIKNDPKPLILINTHHHWDHIWGNSLFGGNIIIAHSRCRELIESKWELMLQRSKHYISGEIEMSLPNLVFEEELYFPEDKIRLLYTPGHTEDCISVVDEEEGILNAGDNIGDTMEELLPELYGAAKDYRETILRYSKLDFDTCISGHNRILGKEVIRSIQSML